MKKELDDKLCEKYPKIFVNRGGSKMETCMYWGFACGDGWYDLIDKLCSNLQWNTDHNGQPQVVAAQVKEKFGTLNFYVDSSTPEQFAVIRFAESLSAHVCEFCGTNQNMGKTTNWIRNICGDCSTDQRHPWNKNKENENDS